jgi:hypothetical protein
MKAEYLGSFFGEFNFDDFDVFVVVVLGWVG